MKHFYQAVPGMFNFQNLYSRMVQEADDPSHFVEVGTFLGKSAAFMVTEIINSKKTITFDVIDTFQGSPTVEEEQGYAEEITGDYYSQFLLNIKPASGFIRPFPTNSVSASKRYDNASLDFVYIDAAHNYDSVMADIEAWYPKVREGGYIGGHDYRTNCPGVWNAVNNFFGQQNITQIKTSWLIKL